MCGICGILGKPDREIIERMNRAMITRGPDDSGIYLDDAIALGMRRLCILDLSSAAHQPMATEDGKLWIIYNGEVYNFKEQRRHLESNGYHFRSQSDTEVILRLYQVYGADCVHQLRGMFSFAIWDRERRHLFLVRDRLGIKPLYYAWVGRCFLFASELKAILASGLIERRLDPEAVRSYLTFGYVYPPRTMVGGVKALLPGHWLTLSADGRESVEQYWDLPSESSVDELRRAHYPELVKHLRTLLSESVRMHLVSDVPLGAFLSGGVDSSTVVGLMAETCTRPVKTFSIGFDAAGQAIDESEEAATGACHFGSDHTKLVVTGQHVLDNLEQIILTLDQPSIDGVNTYLVSKLARQQVTVALSGLGGDELFAGYGTFGYMAYQMAASQRKPWRTGVNQALARAAGWSFWNPLFLTPLARYVEAARMRDGFLNRYGRSRRLFSSTEQVQLLSPEFARKSKVGTSIEDMMLPFDDASLQSPIGRVSRLELKTFMAFQLLRDMDAMSMAHSLEVRVPLIDHKVVEFAFALPAEYKLSFNGTLGTWGERTLTYRQSGAKRVLIDAVHDLLPPGLEERTKLGFGMPYTQWLRTDLWPVVQETLNPFILARMGVFQPQSVQRLLTDFEAGRANWSTVWGLVVLVLWCRLVLGSNPI